MSPTFDPQTSAPREVRENLWAKAFSDYWSDPRNVIGPPGALVRRCFKALWLILSVYVLFWIAGPSQVASWRLWMHDQQLAQHIAWGFTFASALCFAVVGYAAEGSQPFRVPLIVPTIEFEERKYKGWKIKPMHLHLPNVRVALGSMLCAGLFCIALLGMWNFYLHEQQQAGGASVAALEGSSSRLEDAQAALRAHDQQAAAAAAAATLAIQRTSDGSPTGRSRLVRQQAEASRLANEQRQQLVAELNAARGAAVTTHQDYSDPRPVDLQVAGATGAPRSLVASLLDLLRSGVVEALLVMGAGLGVAGATSRIGVPKEGEQSTEAQEEVVAPTAAAPDAAPPPEPRRRYTLPPATAEHYARAVAVGPLPGPEGQPEAAPLVEEAEVPANETPSSEAPEAIDDPIVAEALAADAAQEPEVVGDEA